MSSSLFSSGVVRVWDYSGWGNICDDLSYGLNEANVICCQLGYTGASSYYRAGLTRYIMSIPINSLQFFFCMVIQLWYRLPFHEVGWCCLCK